MKKILSILLAVAMIFCFAGCGGNEDSQGDTQAKPQEKGFSFTYNGTEITLHAPAEPIVAALGEPKQYSESTSCAFVGLDKSYGYGSFYLETYPVDGKDFVYGWWFVDDMVENEEGICIGSTQAEVEAAYGADTFNGSNAFTVKRGDGVLTILLENGVVSSVQYTILGE